MIRQWGTWVKISYGSIGNSYNKTEHNKISHCQCSCCLFLQDKFFTCNCIYVVVIWSCARGTFYFQKWVSICLFLLRINIIAMLLNMCCCDQITPCNEIGLQSMFIEWHYYTGTINLQWCCVRSKASYIIGNSTISSAACPCWCM